MNESIVKYLAGLLDADGSLSFAFKCDPNRPDRHFVGLQLSLASSIAVDKRGFVPSLTQLTGMGTISRYGNNQQFVTWRISKRADLEMILPRLIKHMVIKARHWQWLLDEWREFRRTSCDEQKRDELKAASKQSRKDRVGSIYPKNHPTWAWLSGYLDGDGCYSYRKHLANGYWQWAIHVSAVAHVDDIVGLELIQKSFGGHIRRRKSDDVMIWRRSLGYQNRSFALRFLPYVAKHSRLKRQKIDAIIHHHRQRLSVPGPKRVSDSLSAS